MTRSALVMSWHSDRTRTRIFEFTRQLSFLGSASGPVVRPEAPSLPSPASGGGGACGLVTDSILQPFINRAGQPWVKPGDDGVTSCEGWYQKSEVRNQKSERR